MKKALKLETFSTLEVGQQKKNAAIINFNNIKERTNYGKEGRRPEIGLWKAVIMQSVLDIMSNSSRASDVLAKKVAIDWLNLKNENFLKVCGYADLNPEWVLKKIKYALENPRTWRRDCDLKKTFFK